MKCSVLIKDALSPLHQEMLIILITILKAQIHRKQNITWDLPTPTSAEY